MSEAAHHGKQTETTDLPSVKLGIGDVLQLQDFSAGKEQHYVKLIGYMGKKSVLVSHPMRDEKLLFVKKGESYLVRGFSGTKTYEFTSDVVNVCLAPFPYLHLSFPAQVTTVNMRRALRIKLKLVCSVKSKASANPIPATIVDMSVSGARIQSRTEVGQLGEDVTVSFRLPVDGEEMVFVVPAIIRNIGSDAEGSGVVCGMEFHQIEARDRIPLQNYIYKHMAEN
ncbi:MAG TPA: flagellar brake protein [Sideroxyarcus sp.]|nr:flagellar brake protein [Sideroxyarcus sp.]